MVRARSQEKGASDTDTPFRFFKFVVYLLILPFLMVTLSEPLALISPTPSTLMVQEEQMLPFTVPPEMEVDMVDDEPLTLMSYDFESLLTRLTAEALVAEVKRAAAMIRVNFMYSSVETIASSP